jgi:Glucosyl transferase GtrII
MSTSSTGIRAHAADLSAANAESSLRTLSLREYVLSSSAILLVIAATIFGIFLPALIVPYAFTDDYPVLSIADGLGPNPWFGNSIIDTVATSGRLFAALLDKLVFSAAGTIDNLRFVRLLAVLGIVGLAFLLHWALVRSGVKRTLAALIAVLVCSMPAFQVYGSWAVLFNVPYAAILGGGASLLAVAAVDAPRDLVADRLAGAIAMLVASLLIYQSAAMFFWVFLAVALIGAARDERRALRLVRAHFGIAAVALGLTFLIVKVAIHLIGDAAPNAARTALTHDVIGKARWFFRGPLYGSLSLFDLTPSRWLAALVATTAIGGILLLLRHERVRSLPYVAIGALLIPLSFLPNLVVAENSPTYRVQVSITSLIALYFCLGALGVWVTLRDWLRPRVSGQTLIAAKGLAAATAVAFVASSAFIAGRNVTTLFVVPQTTELRMIRSQVAALPNGIQQLAFVQTGNDQGMSKFVSVDEFGVPSSARPWSLQPSVLLILREEGRLPHGARPTVDALPPWTSTYPKNVPVVDVRGLQRLR